MSTIKPRFEITVGAAIADPRVGIVRDSDEKRYDFSTNTFVGTVPVQPGTPLGPYFAGSYDYRPTTPIDTGASAQFTDGIYLLSVYDGTAPTPLVTSLVMQIASGVEVYGGTSTVTGPVTVGAYSAGQDPGTYVLATPADKLATDGSGRVTAVGGGGTGLTFAAGAVSAVTSGSAFSGTGAGLAAPSGGYNGMWLTFTAGTQAETKRLIAAHTVSGSVHAFTFAVGFAGAPAVADAFFVA